jgi:conjugative relaxase-like TrwC/TraI family protein
MAGPDIAGSALGPSRDGGTLMLSVGVIAAGGVGYYLDTVASGLDDYYARSEPGRWLGAGANAVGLDGEVTVDQIEQLIAGINPVTGDVLGQRATKVAALDLTFSAPKSVSLLAELSGAATRRAVRDGHDRAVAATIAFLESDGVLVGPRPTDCSG